MDDSPCDGTRRGPVGPISTLRRRSSGRSAGKYHLVHVQGVNNFLPPSGTRRRPAVGGSDRGHLPHWWSLQPHADDGEGGAVASPATPAPQDEGVDRGLSLRGRGLGSDVGMEPERIRLIRNGAEPLPLGDSVPGISGSPLVCSVARLERYKGHHRLIAAMPALLELAPDAHLAVIGRGGYEPQLRHLVARLQVEHAVTFTSFDATQRPALGALLRSSDVVALMSDYEANPVAVMEALALGRKVVVADTSGLSELASEGLATAVPPNVSPRELAGVLARLAVAPDPGAPTCRPGTAVPINSSHCTRRPERGTESGNDRFTQQRSNVELRSADTAADVPPAGTLAAPVVDRQTGATFGIALGHGPPPRDPA